MKLRHITSLAFVVFMTLQASFSAEANSAPVLTSISIADHPHDQGTALDVTVHFKPNAEASEAAAPFSIVLEKSGDPKGLFSAVKSITPTAEDMQRGRVTLTVGGLQRNRPVWFRAATEEQSPATAEMESSTLRSGVLNSDPQTPGIPTRQFFDESKFWLLLNTLFVCGAIIGCIAAARSGMSLKIRQIAGLEAIEDAVGRATEMGRSCLFIPGIQDMNEMQTIAGLTLLSRVAERAAEYDCDLETPTAKSLVMTAARDTVASAFLKAGRPDAYRPDSIYYVSDEQFAYVAYLSGKMVREKPAACFYLGSFYAESLILAETGNSIGAIQIAGTAQPGQIPFFVAACDYTLIGEEFFAASAYLSRDPDQVGSLKGQDLCKLVYLAVLIAGVIYVTAVQFV